MKTPENFKTTSVSKIKYFIMFADRIRLAYIEDMTQTNYLVSFVNERLEETVAK